MNPMINIMDKIVTPKECVAGKHTFIPATWKIQPGTQTCTLFVCQHCLVSADKVEVEVMREAHHAAIRIKKAQKEADAKE